MRLDVWVVKRKVIMITRADSIFDEKTMIPVPIFPSLEA